MKSVDRGTSASERRATNEQALAFSDNTVPCSSKQVDASVRAMYRRMLSRKGEKEAKQLEDPIVSVIYPPHIDNKIPKCCCLGPTASGGGERSLPVRWGLSGEEQWPFCLHCFHTNSKEISAELLTSLLAPFAQPIEYHRTQDNRQLTNSLPLTTLYALQRLYAHQYSNDTSSAAYHSLPHLGPPGDGGSVSKEYFTIHYIGADGTNEMNCSFRHILMRVAWCPDENGQQHKQCRGRHEKLTDEDDDSKNERKNIVRDRKSQFRDLVLVSVGFVDATSGRQGGSDITWTTRLKENELSQPVSAFYNPYEKQGQLGTNPPDGRDVKDYTRLQLLFSYKGLYHEFLERYPEVLAHYVLDSPTASQLRPDVCVFGCPIFNKSIESWLPTLNALIKRNIICVVTASSSPFSFSHDGKCVETILRAVGANIVLPAQFNKFPIYFKHALRDADSKTECDSLIIAKHGVICCFKGFGSDRDQTNLISSAADIEVLRQRLASYGILLIE